MLMDAPIVSQYMTPTPYTVEPDADLGEALRTMERYQIHHLPVLSEGKILGLLSLHDIRLLTTHAPLSIDTIRVSDVMGAHPHCVGPQASLSSVAQHMADHRLDAALVVQEDASLIGIFTHADALSAFARLLRQLVRKEAHPLATADQLSDAKLP